MTLFPDRIRNIEFMDKRVALIASGSSDIGGGFARRYLSSAARTAAIYRKAWALDERIHHYTGHQQLLAAHGLERGLIADRLDLA